MVSSWTVAITCQGYPYRLQHGETCPPIRGACGSPSLFLNNLQKNIDSKLLMMHYVNLLREGFIKKGQSLVFDQTWGTKGRKCNKIKNICSNLNMLEFQKAKNR